MLIGFAVKLTICLKMGLVAAQSTRVIVVIYDDNKFLRKAQPRPILVDVIVQFFEVIRVKVRADETRELIDRIVILLEWRLKRVWIESLIDILIVVAIHLLIVQRVLLSCLQLLLLLTLLLLLLQH